MARHVPITFHHANRKVVWFPPSSNPQLLMEGIQKHKIEYVISVSREDSYYLPPDDDCLAALQAAYPAALQLVESGPDFRIFKTVTSETVSNASPSQDATSTSAR
jgi:hypothetical protein